MILGRHMDGRVLGYNESTYRFDLSGHLVTGAAVEMWDKMDLIAWGSPEQRQWFISVGGARFDNVALQVASAAELLHDDAPQVAEQPAAEQVATGQAVVEQPAAEQPVAAAGEPGKPVWSSQPMELGPDTRADLGGEPDGQPEEPAAGQQAPQAQPSFAPAQQPVMQQPAAQQPVGQPYPGPYPQPASDRPVPPVGWNPQGQGAPAQQAPVRQVPPQQWQQPQQPAAWQPALPQWQQPYPGQQPVGQDPRRKRRRIELAIVIIVLVVIAVIAIAGAWVLGTTIGHEIISGADPLSSLPGDMDGFNT